MTGRQGWNASRWRRAVTRRVASRLLGEFADITYAQEGEDRILLRIFGRLESGYYVDVGAHHPARFSNTYLLYQRGWRGLAIDPLPLVVSEYRRLRPRDIALEMAIAAAPGRMTYFEFDEPALNTLSPERARFLEATTAYRLVSTRDVEVDRLDNVLDRYVPAHQPIDLLCVDTEGFDMEVLASNDWTRFTPQVVVAEALGSPSMDELVASPMASLLRPNGYVLFAKTFNSVFFVHKSGAAFDRS